MQNKNLLIFIVAIVALEAILFLVGNNKLNLVFWQEEYKLAIIQNALAGVLVEAKAVSVYDAVLNRELYGKNDIEVMPLASLVKTMTVLVALQDKDPNATIIISKNALDQFGEYGFSEGEKWRIEDLAKFTLIGSANDGAYALSEGDPDILQKMNEKAKRLGMQNTTFLNPTGLDTDAGAVGGYGSALDANIMALFALKARPEIFSATVLPEMNLKSESGFEHNIKNTNIILDKIPNLLFSKTGFTELAGGNLTVIFKNKEGHDIAITVLGSTFDGRFSDMEKLVNAVYNQDYGSRN